MLMGNINQEHGDVPIISHPEASAAVPTSLLQASLLCHSPLLTSLSLLGPCRLLLPIPSPLLLFPSLPLLA